VLFSLDPGAPTNAVIGSTNGFFSWTPGDANIGVYAITVRATDSIIPSLSGTWTFTVTVVPRPTFTSSLISGNQVSLAWSAISGDAYQVQTATSLLGTWSGVPGNVHATNSIATKTVSFGPGTRRFYRVLVLP
jgi:hypothetical protein